ncbi:MAG: arginase [Fimbriimonadaceae bacterium]|nr:arginase [Fimbriimonadaceae bacterium]
MIDLIGAPYDLSGPMLGSRIGPWAMRLLGFSQALKDLGASVNDLGDAFPISQEVPQRLSKRYAEGISAYKALRKTVAGSLKKGHLPVVMGGDHSLAIGTVSGALDVYGDDLAVVWIDAHMDLNTPDTTPSGNMHGMPLAALTMLAPGMHYGRTEKWSNALTEAWSEILSDVVPRPGLRRSNVAWIGLRDVDEGEVRNQQGMPGSLVLTMQDVDRLTAPGAIKALADWTASTGAKKLWISFDVDALDPVFAPGTGTAVRGGLTYREGHLLAETLHEIGFTEGGPFQIVGVDLVEVNPLHDNRGETARVAIEWASSLFGKSIMHKKTL